MMMQYNIGDFSNVESFLSLLAKKMGKLKKGGIPDVKKSGKKVLQDWNMCVVFCIHCTCLCFNFS